jgi:hypothetical protein
VEEDDIEDMQELLKDTPQADNNTEQNLEFVKTQITCNLKKVLKFDKTLLSTSDSNLSHLLKGGSLKLLDKGYPGVLASDRDHQAMDCLVAQLDAFSTTLKVLDHQQLRGDQPFRELLFKAK